jgi:hypothetical protein
MPADNLLTAGNEPPTAGELLAGLTEKQAEFCRSYVVENNASLAARTAGYSAKAAAAIGYKLLRRPSICRALAALRAELADSGAVAPAAVLSRMKAQALGNVTDLLVKRRRPIVNDAGQPAIDSETGAELAQDVWEFRPPDQLSPEAAALVAAVSLNTRQMRDGSIRQTISYKTVDGQRALADLAKALGLNSETVNHTHGGTIEHSVSGMFRFIASAPATAETTGRIGAGGANGRRRPVTIDQPPE